MNLIVAILFLFPEANLPVLESAWIVEAEFESPEAAVFDPSRNVIYVSNVSGYEKNGRGFLSRISVEGQLLDIKWLSGINAPTGLAMHKNLLYAVDFDRLLVIDPSGPEIIRIINAPEGVTELNDVAITADGTAYVSGSGTATIYRSEQSRLVSWRAGAYLTHVNGLHAEQDRLLAAGQGLIELPLATEQHKVLYFSDEFQDLEGIAALKGRYFISSVGQPKVWSYRNEQPNGVLAVPGYTGDLSVSDTHYLLILPTGPDRVQAFHIR